MRIHHNQPTTARTPCRHSWPWLAALALLAAGGAHAATHFVDFGAGCKAVAPDCSVDPCVTINATAGTAFTDTIQGQNTGGNTPSWAFDVTPAGCGVGPAFDCNNVDIAVDGSGDPVNVSTDGAGPSSGGTFTFALEGSIPGKLCYEGFELVIADPYDLVLVLDRSGSMDWTTFIQPPATSRWDALERAVNGFTPIVEGSSCAPQSGFGLTFFSTNVLPNNSFSSTLATPITASLHTDVNTEMVSQRPPAGWTAMGSGLQNGIGKLASPGKKRVVMLFSDGEQNQDPCVNHLNGTEYSTGGTPTCSATGASGAGTIAPAGAGAFKIVTVGIGNPTNDYHDALQRLATNHGGSYHVTQTGQNLAAALDTATQDLLDGCSAQMVASFSGTLAGTVDLGSFDVNHKVRKLFLKLSYGKNFEVPSLAQLLAGVHIEKDGTDVTGFFRPVIVGNFTDTAVLETDFTIPGSGTTMAPDGTYSVSLTASPNFASLSYRAVVFVDDQRLGIDSGVSPAAPRAGGSFEPRLDLTWFNAPVVGATVQALILQPGDDIGDALARNPFKVDPASGADAGSAGQQKFEALLEDADFLAQILPQEQQIALTDQGDGTYSGSFAPGTVSGVYQVIYRVRADDAASFGKLQRQVSDSVYVKPNQIDLAASNLGTTLQNGNLVLQLKPVTVDGRFWGPAQGGAIQVTGAAVSRIDDDQFGGYAVTLDGTPGDISVKLLDEEIYSGPAVEFGSAGRPAGTWPAWWWLLILLLLVLVIWVFRKITS